MICIVAVIDFSSSSISAARYAADIAVAVEGKLLLVHLLSDDEENAPGINPSIEITAAREHLLRRTGNRIVIETALLGNERNNTLQQYCQDHQPWTIVMDTMHFRQHLMAKQTKISDFIGAVKAPLLLVHNDIHYDTFINIHIIKEQPEYPHGSSLVAYTRKWLQTLVKPNVTESMTIQEATRSILVTNQFSSTPANLLVHPIITNEGPEYLYSFVRVNTPVLLPSLSLFTKEKTAEAQPLKVHNCAVCNGACKSKKLQAKAE